MKDYLMWVYHSEHEPKVINSSELESYLKDEGKESPAELAGAISLIEEALQTEGRMVTEAEVSAIGVAYNDCKEIANFMLNIDKERSKKKIVKFLRERHTDETPIYIPDNAGLKELRELCHEVFS